MTVISNISIQGEFGHMFKFEDFKENPNARIILSTGHFGNFELGAWISNCVPNVQVAVTYRALRQPRLNDLLLELRNQSGCWYFERRTDGKKLKAAMATPRLVLGLLADQYSGDKGLPLPVFGRTTSVNLAPAVFAKRYGCRIFPSACFRTSPGRWTIELGEEIPVRENVFSLRLLLLQSKFFRNTEN